MPSSHITTLEDTLRQVRLDNHFGSDGLKVKFDGMKQAIKGQYGNTSPQYIQIKTIKCLVSAGPRACQDNLFTKHPQDGRLPLQCLAYPAYSMRSRHSLASSSVAGSSFRFTETGSIWQSDA